MQRALGYLAGLLAIVFLVFWAGTTDLIRVVSKARLEYLSLALLCYGGVLIVMSLRWRLLLSSLGSLSVPRSFRAVLMGLTMGDFTPGRAGDAFRAYLAKKDGIGDFAATLPLWAVERLLDIVVVASAALLTYATIAEILPTRGFAPLLAVPLLAAAVLLVLILALNRFPRAGETLFHILLRPLRRLHLFEANPAATFFASGREAFRPERLVPVLALTGLLWGLHILRVTLVARGLGADVPLSTMAFVVPAAYIAAAIPITPGGLGLLELGAASLLIGAAGLPPGTAVAIPILDRAIISPVYLVPGLLLIPAEVARSFSKPR